MEFKFQFCPKEILMQKKARNNRIGRDFLIILYVSKVAGQKYNYYGFWSSTQCTLLVGCDVGDKLALGGPFVKFQKEIFGRVAMEIFLGSLRQAVTGCLYFQLTFSLGVK